MGIILVDMDGVLADFGATITAIASTHLGYYIDPKALFGPGADKETKRLRSKVIELIKDIDGFYGTIAPIPGALSALKRLKDDGHTIFICTAPSVLSRDCASQKTNWVRHHFTVFGGAKFAEYFVRRLIITKDKTMVRGDILIDDRPQCGQFSPVWKYIQFKYPHNERLPEKNVVVDRIQGWGDPEWKKKIESALICEP